MGGREKLEASIRKREEDKVWFGWVLFQTKY